MTPSMRQRLFVSYYLGEAKGNGTLAATWAKYSNPDVAASKLLTSVKVKRLLAAHMAEVAMPAKEVLARLSRQASADMGDFLAPVTDPDDPPAFDFKKAKRRDQLGNIKTIKRITRTIPRRDAPPEVEVKVELQVFDPRPALETLAKFHGLTGREPDEPEDAATDGKKRDLLGRLAGLRAARDQGGVGGQPEPGGS